MRKLNLPAVLRMRASSLWRQYQSLNSYTALVLDQPKFDDLQKRETIRDCTARPLIVPGALQLHAHTEI
jgi:hypothetical protein